MMTKVIGKPLITVFALVIFLGKGFLFSQIPSTASPIKIDIRIPIVSLDLSDLDARDEFNRPVKKSIQFRRIVITGLNNMILENLTPVRRSIRNLLQLNWDVIAGTIRKHFNTVTERVQAWLASSKKQKSFSSVRLAVPSSRPPVLHEKFQAKTRFLYLISSLLSSTVLLR